jgi:adenylate kinase
LSQCVIGASLEDVAEEEEAEEEEGNAEAAETKVGVYEIVGTLKNPAIPPPDFVKDVVKFSNKDELYEQLLGCDVIIYDITEEADQIEEATWAASQLHSDLEKLDKSKPQMFILVSTIMTWARSKPLDPEDPEIPFTEDDYRRRKPHPNFKEHISAEKMVLKFGKTNKSKLSTYVIASGLTYGAGENIFHQLFKAAWHNEPELVCYGNGRNIVPTIHIRDLAAVLQNVADSRPKVRYIIAVDDSKSKLRQIVKAVSKALTTGKIRNIPQNEALLDKQLKQEHFDMLLVNLRMDGVFVKENMHIKWTSEMGIVENIMAIVKEFKETRGLQPMRVFIHGPPASGKTTVVEQLCAHFKLHHIKIKDVIDETITKMQKYIEDKSKPVTEPETVEKDEDVEEEEEEEEDEAEEEDLTAEYQEMLETIKENQAENNGRLDDSHIVKFFREKLHSKPCQNQGFILDGFPKTVEQAKELFAAGEEAAEEADDGAPDYDVVTMPELIITLEATDEFLRKRVINLPENIVFGTHNTEEGLNRRLAEFRAINTDDETVLNYFDELEFHPERIDVTKDTSVRMKETVDKIIRMMGQPRNYGPTPEELAEIKRAEAEAKVKKDAADKAEMEKHEAEEAELRKKRREEWSQRLEEVRREEQELLEAQSIPLRNYLMKHVMPTLTLGLRDCVAVRPDDPIDFLAEYLFRNNPQVD